MNANGDRAIGASLRDIRLESGLTQVELAEALGKPQSYVSKVESGERSLHLVEVSSYARALGMTAAELVARLERDLG